jgi:hypothetical protein
MKTIPLTQGQVALVDDEDYVKISEFKWRAEKSGSIKYKDAFYASRSEHASYKHQRRVHMHRFILNPPENMQVDHIDGNGLNNQKCNLRVVTCRENLQNRHHKKTSQYPGVYLYRNKSWRAQIRVGGVLKDLGCHLSEDAAYDAYLNACKEVKKNVR